MKKSKATKRLFIMFFCSLLFVCACSPSLPKEEIMDDGTKITHEDRGDTYIFDSFPREIIYNNTSFFLENVEFYEDSFSGYEKNLYVILYFDMNNMTDEDLYWFKKDESSAIGSPFELPLRASVSVDSEQNNFDNSSLSLRDNFYTSDNFKIMVYQLDNYRYSLSGESVSLALYVKQGGTYEYTNDDGDIRDLDKEDTYYYFSDIPATLDGIDSLQSINESIYDAIF